jgi:uncharacterized sulfatase
MLRELMSMRLRLAGWFGTLAIAAGCGAHVTPRAVPAPPNVVLILSDDHAWTDYGFMGHPVVRTPNIDALAAEGLRFTRGYNVTSVCRPSLATYATGLFPHQHGITGNDPPGDRTAARDPAARASMEAVFSGHPTVATLLARAGYRSLQTGKWWEGDPKAHGFTEAMTHGDVARGGRHGDDGLTIGREGMQPIETFLDATRATGQPFFLWYAPFMPHTPHTPPDRLLAKYRTDGRPEALARYYAMIEWFDETVGDLMASLDRRGLRENTLVLYIADNGWLQAEVPREQGRTPGKMSPYDAGLRTPIIVRWPGHVTPARDDRTLASGIDIVPTILSAARVAIPAALPGLPLTDRQALTARDMVFGSLSAHTSVDVLQPAANLKYRMAVSQDGWKLILPYIRNRDVTLTIDGVTGAWAAGTGPELYDLTNDPRETHNRSAEQPGIVNRLRSRIDKWWSVPE